ncbi:MAG: hypothetical protein LKK19_01975 [Bacteroidales bacterium]|jgi:hypothetical protein|nr:hypothetical protein [Bacteroidales bacterium]MCI2121454.1 hypothetical protein [Bacteroidales bacterium]MCI2145878.1 hypothetical protein [Bacteroidales bacterium]
MKRILINILLFVCCAFTLESCDWFEYSQKETNYGKNVLSFMYDDLPFYQDVGGRPVSNCAFLHINDSGDSVHIHAKLIGGSGLGEQDIYPIGASIFIALDDLKDGAVINDNAQYWFYWCIGDNWFYSSPELDSCRLTIRKWDRDSLVLSGNFSLYGHVKEQAFTITKGNFDVSQNDKLRKLFYNDSFNEYIEQWDNGELYNMNKKIN